MSLEAALNIESLRERARRRLPRFVFDYVEGGAEDEVTLRRNVEAFERIRWRPRSLIDVGVRSAARPLFGVDAKMPVAVGPTGLAGLCWSHGDLELAKASHAFGVPFVLSCAGGDSLEDVRKALPDARLWFQTYVFKDRAVADGLIRRAAAAGYEALVLTVDVPVPAKRERDWKNGFKQPLQLTWSARFNVLFHLGWLFDIYFRQPRFVNVEEELKGKIKGDVLFPSLFDPSVTWADLERVRAAWPRKLIVKGVLSPEDAVRMVELGADGIGISNHGGRQLDGTPSAIEVLPEITTALKGRASLFVDGGVRRGGDIAKAIALGADGIFLGRAPLYGLAAGGQRGVERSLRILSEELDRVLALVGCPRLAELDARFVDRA